MWIEIQRIKNKPQTVRKYLQNTFDQIFEWAKDLKRQVTKEEIQMAKQHVKRCSTSQTITVSTAK